MGCKPRLLYVFFGSSLNNQVKQAAPKEVMRFGKAPHRLLGYILEEEPCLCPTYLSKVYLADTYMHTWVNLNNIPSVAFLLPR